MFSVNSYATIWKVNDRKSNYTVCQMSTSKKNSQTGRYETDFSDNKVRFVGKAHQQMPQEGQRIKILNCGVSNYYDKEKKVTYVTYVVFDYTLDGETPTMTPAFEEDLPFIF